MKFNKYIALILTTTLVISCIENEKDGKVTSAETQLDENKIVLTKQQFDHNNMKIEGLEDRPFSELVKANGMIDVPPANKAIINAFMGGYIKTTPLLVGDIIKKGQVLVTIENPKFVTLQQEFMEVKEQILFLESEFERQKILFEENITSQKKYLKAQSDFKSSMAKYSGLKKQLQMLNISTSNAENGNFTSVATIYSPISGSISKVNVSMGMYVSPASQIMEIINKEHLHVELSVFEKDIMQLQKGQEIDFRVPEASDEIFEADVHLIGTSIDENRTVKVHGHIDDELKNNFIVGMFVEANIITEKELLKSLPTDAIVEKDGMFYALLVISESNDEIHFKQVELETGKVFRNFTEIKNASIFSTSDRFLTTGVFSLLGE